MRPRTLLTRRLSRRPTGSALAGYARHALLFLAVLMGLLGAGDQRSRLLLALVGGLALCALLPWRDRRVRLALIAAEVVAATVGIVAADVLTGPLLLCLPASSLAAATLLGPPGAVAVVGLAAAVTVGVQVLHPGPTQYSGTLAQWLLVALAIGLLGGRLGQLSGQPESTGQEQYVAAYRLLAQLRAVTDRLPGSFDPGSVARTLLEQCIQAVGCEHGSVLLHVGGDELVALALHGYQRVPWRVSLNEGGPVQRAWLSGAPALDRRQADPDGGRRGSALLVLPMSVNEQRVGVAVLESRSLSAFPSDEVALLSRIVADFALPLETAALFDELRAGAAVEERARLAREMHDGIAQDLAYLGYQLDALTAMLGRAGEVGGADAARQLRRRMTELIGDLRVSMTDLRSSVGPGRGLGAALSEYARAVGTSTSMTVNLSLTEGSSRLPADTEVQLLRIAHEAISQARRRPGTANLWVTLVTDPPSATLVIEDDGHLRSPVPADSSAIDTEPMNLMYERARRIGADFLAEHRTPHGVRVSVTVRGGQR